MTPEQIKRILDSYTLCLQDEQGNIITKANGEPLKGKLSPSGEVVFEKSDLRFAAALRYRDFSINPEKTRLIPLQH